MINAGTKMYKLRNQLDSINTSSNVVDFKATEVQMSNH